ncbi:hypothetical protein AALB39_04510 [Lachnospiraceae bacterium 54-53]
MGTLSELITLAKTQEGYIEKASNSSLDSKTANKGSNNYQKFSSDINSAGLNGCQAQAWCCTFQFWLDLMIYGVDIALYLWNMTKSTYVGYNCFATYNAFANKGKVGSSPKLGAIVIFNFSHAGRVIDIYKKNGNVYISCIEGNTSSNLNDRNGGQVKIKERLANDSTIKGYCYIDYEQFEQRKQYGWHNEDGGQRYYLGDAEGNAAAYVKSDWYKWKSEKDGNEYWSFFLGNNGFAVCNDWYQYNNKWYFFNEECVMLSNQWRCIKEKWYYFCNSGEMVTSAYVKSKSKDDIYYFINSDGIWEGKEEINPDTSHFNVF